MIWNVPKKQWSLALALNFAIWESPKKYSNSILDHTDYDMKPFWVKRKQQNVKEINYDNAFSLF